MKPKRPAAAAIAAALLSAALLLPPAAAQTPKAEPPDREPTARELGEAMGEAMGQMGRMMGDMAQTMGGTMQRMLDAMQKERDLQEQQNRHIEGKLAFIRAELQIAPAQEKAWADFADAMRKAAATRPAETGSRGATLPERLDRQTRQLEDRLAALQAKKSAIDRLYSHLDAKQKTLADDLIEQIGLV